MRRALAIGLLAAMVATGCSRVMFGDPDVIKAGELVSDFGEALTAYDEIFNQLDYDDRGVVTLSSLDEWDLALFELESSHRAMSTQLNEIKESEEIKAFDRAAATYLDVHRNQAQLIRQCYSNAAQHDPSTCALEVLNANFIQELLASGKVNEAMAGLKEAHGG